MQTSYVCRVFLLVFRRSGGPPGNGNICEEGPRRSSVGLRFFLPRALVRLIVRVTSIRAGRAGLEKKPGGLKNVARDTGFHVESNSFRARSAIPVCVPNVRSNLLVVQYLASAANRSNSGFRFEREMLYVSNLLPLL